MHDDARHRILAAVRALRRGETASYGEVAERAGLPRRARLVARVLTELPQGTRLPWHRVVGAGGRIAPAPGSPVALEQARRLRAEGHSVSGARIRRKPSAGLDALLWGQPGPRTGRTR